MYVAILSSALDEWVTDLAGSDLIEYAVLCREELRSVSPPNGGSAYAALAAEIAYDRALIAICTELGIDAHATTFAYPIAERQRIEGLLQEVGIDLESPEWRPDVDHPPPGVYPDTTTVAEPKSETEGRGRTTSKKLSGRPTRKPSAADMDTDETLPLQ